MSSCDSKKQILIHVQTHQYFKHFLTLSGSGVAISDVKICRTASHVNVKCIFIAYFQRLKLHKVLHKSNTNKEYGPVL